MNAVLYKINRLYPGINNYKAIQFLKQFEKTQCGNITQLVTLDELKPKSPSDIGYRCLSGLNKEGKFDTI